MLDKNKDNSITIDELVDAAPRLGLTEKQAKEVFAEVDENNSGSIDKDEFKRGFGGALVAAELTTPIERAWAYFVEPRRPAGIWSPLDPEKTSLEDPWISLYTSFTPTHVHFLAIRIVAMMVEAFVLGGMHGWTQGVVLTTFHFFVMGFTLWNPSGILLAQSRADSIDAVGKFLTFGIYSFSFTERITAGYAAQAMTVVNVLVLVHSLFTQLEPILRAAVLALFACCCITASAQATTTDDADKAKNAVVSLKDLPSTEEGVALLWHRLRAKTISEVKVPEAFYQALKDVHDLTIQAGNNVGMTDDTKYEALFEECLASLNLKEMTSPVAMVLLQQMSVRKKLMSASELADVLKESKYSADGRLSRAERASRSLSIDDESPLFKSSSSRLSKDRLTKDRLSKDIEMRSLKGRLSGSFDVKRRPSNTKNLKPFNSKSHNRRDTEKSPMHARIPSGNSGRTRSARYTIETQEKAGGSLTPYAEESQNSSTTSTPDSTPDSTPSETPNSTPSMSLFDSARASKDQGSVEAKTDQDQAPGVPKDPVVEYL